MQMQNNAKYLQNIKWKMCFKNNIKKPGLDYE